MTVERGLRLMAGTFVLLSLGLGYWVSPYWYLVHGICRTEPLTIGLHQLVSRHVDAAEAGTEILGRDGASYSGDLATCLR